MIWILKITHLFICPSTWEQCYKNTLKTPKAQFLMEWVYKMKILLQFRQKPSNYPDFWQRRKGRLVQSFRTSKFKNVRKMDSNFSDINIGVQQFIFPMIWFKPQFCFGSIYDLCFTTQTQKNYKRIVGKILFGCANERVTKFKKNSVCLC